MSRLCPLCKRGCPDLVWHHWFEDRIGSLVEICPSCNRSLGVIFNGVYPDWPTQVCKIRQYFLQYPCQYQNLVDEDLPKVYRTSKPIESKLTKGKLIREMEKELGTSKPTLSRIRTRYRHKSVLESWISDTTLTHTDIGKLLNISRQRAQVIIKEAGLPSHRLYFSKEQVRKFKEMEKLFQAEAHSKLNLKKEN